MQAVLRLAHGGAGAEDIRQAVEVIDLRAPQVLNGLPGRLDRAAQLTGHDDLFDIQVLLGINAGLERLFPQLPGIGRAGPDDGGLIGLEHKEQALAGQRAAPDAQGAEVLGADDVRAAHIEGEVEGMDIPVVGPHADLPEPAALRFLELIKILLGEGAHGGHAGGTGRSGNEDHVLLRHGGQFPQEGTHTLGIPLGLLVNKGELLNVLQGLDIGRLHAGLVKGPLVIRSVVIGELHDLLEVLQLLLLQLRARKGFQFLIPVLVMNVPAHNDLLLIICQFCSFCRSDSISRPGNPG